MDERVKEVQSLVYRESWVRDVVSHSDSLLPAGQEVMHPEAEWVEVVQPQPRFSRAEVHKQDVSLGVVYSMPGLWHLLLSTLLVPYVNCMEFWR